MTGSPRLAQRKTADIKTADIFCKVIDNFGDAGVCWRLARQLADEYQIQVRLCIDRPEVLAVMLPALADALNNDRSTTAAHVIGGIEVCHWQEETEPLTGPPADLVIAAFACNLPPAYRDSMKGLSRFMLTKDAMACGPEPGSAWRATPGRPPLLSSWINLEYLSAEAWIEDHHALPSLKPDGLVEQFWFPGFSDKTGGLIREAGLLARRDAFLANAGAQQALAAELGLSGHEGPGLDESLLLFVFCYASAPLAALIDAAGLAMEAAGPTGNLSTGLSTGLISPLSHRISLPPAPGLSTALPPQKPALSPALSPDVGALSTPGEQLLGHLPTACPQDQMLPARRPVRRIRFVVPQDMATDLPPGHACPAGVSLHRIARLPQARFDEVLWLCDANFVRGEDSLVRALWAAKPMLWHIYPQQEQAHRPKLEAFLAMRPACDRALSLAWNGMLPPESLAPAFAQWLAGFARLQQVCATLSGQLATQTDLVTRLLCGITTETRT